MLWKNNPILLQGQRSLPEENADEEEFLVGLCKDIWMDKQNRLLLVS